MTALLSCTQVVKVYRTGTTEVIALQGLDLDIEPGEMVGVIGTSGSGKSTLLTIISGLVRPTGGQVQFDGLDLGHASRRELDHYRRVDVGFVWQDAATNLIPYLSTHDNVALPLATAGKANASGRASDLLQLVGLQLRAEHRPHELSGGEQQRVALAVALAHGPRLLLADEPTGELDSATTEEIFSLMRQVGEETGLSQIIVSHDPEVTRHVDRVLSLRDGRVASEQRMGAGASGEAEIVEVTMLDRAGRLQLTEEQRLAIGGSGRVHTELLDGVLHIRPAGDGDD